MTGAEREVTADGDAAWALGIRHERRHEAELLVVAVVTTAALVVLRLDPADPDDRGLVHFFAWLLAGYAVGAVIWVWSGARHGRTDRYRCLHALRQGLDPGPGLRARAGRIARQQRSNRWAAWLTPLVFGPQLLLGHWQNLPLTVPAAVVFAAGLALLTARQRSLGVAARRWLDDPPVPASEREWLVR